jgi:hypothetical protein
MDPVQYQQSQSSQQPYPPTYEQPPAYAYPPPSAYPGYAGPMPPKTSGMAIASLVLSLVGFFWILPVIGPVLGVIFGHMALGEIKRSGGMIEGQGLAIAGLVIGYVGIGILVLVACFFALLLLLSLNAGTPTGFVASGIGR